MCRALDKSVVDIQELVGLPVQIYSSMGALVFVGMELSVVIKNKQFQLTICGRHRKFLSSASGDGVGALQCYP